MVAKDFLNQARTVEMKINSTLLTLMKLEEIATQISSGGSDSGYVDGGLISDKVGKGASGIVDAKNKLKYELDNYIKLQCKINSAIAYTENSTQIKILQMRYIEGCSWNEIEQETHLSEACVMKTHKKALKKVVEFIVKDYQQSIENMLNSE